MRTLAISRLTFSSERHRSEVTILVLIGFLLAFSMSMISLSADLTEQVLGYADSGSSRGENTLMIQGGLFYTEIVAFLIAFLVAMNTFYGDRKSGLLDIVLSKQVTRGQYMLGKFLGALYLCSLAYLIMITPLVGAAVYSGSGNALVSTAVAYLAGCVKVMIYLSLTFFLLMRVPRFIAPIIALVFVAFGYFSQNVSLMVSDTSGVLRWLAMISYVIIPHLTEITVASIFDPLPGTGSDYAVWFGVYGLLYPGLFLSLTWALFRRRSL